MSHKRKADCTSEEWQAHRDRDRERRAKKPESHREAQRRYRAKNPEHVREIERRSRDAARLSMSQEEIEAFRAKRREYCAARFAASSTLREKKRAYNAKARRIARFRKNAAQVYQQLLKLLGAGNPNRYDIASEALIFLLEGKAADIASALVLGRKEHFRKFSRFGQPVSLDQPLQGGQTLHDLVAA